MGGKEAGVVGLPYWAREWIFNVEGGLVDDPDDPGDLTKYGISKRDYPAIDVANLTREEASRIYDRDYYCRVRGPEMPPQIALAVFDSAVHQGPGQAVRLLQFALDAHVDGEVGPETLMAVRSHVAREGVPGLLVEFLSRRADHYADLTHQKLPLRKFQRGWFRRLFLLQAQCLGLSEVA